QQQPQRTSPFTLTIPFETPTSDTFPEHAATLFNQVLVLPEEYVLERDHLALIRAALARLSPGGRLVFSNNYRRFRMDTSAFDDCTLENISSRTLPRDFARNPKIHNAWLITPHA
ncbi:MAG: hypothetical protein AAF499_03920, partial [Pseudomonadota bacterium]